MLLLTTAVTASWAQGNGGQMVEPSMPGPDEEQAKTADNLSQPDQTQIKPPSERRGFFQAGIHLSEITQAQLGDNLGSSPQTSSFTAAVGSLDWLSLRRRSETAVDYIGGSNFYGVSRSVLIQQINATQRILWPRGQLVLSDQFGDLPGGSFGASWFGGAAAYNLTAGMTANPPNPPDLSDLIGATNFTGTGITNASLVGVSEVLSQRSSISATGGYGITNYSLYPTGDNTGLINNHGIGAELTYGYQINRRSQIGLLYGFQDLQFAQVGQGYLETNLGELMYSRQISKRMQLSAGAGPEFARITTLNVPRNQINASAFGSLNYQLRKGSAVVSYNRSVTNGSGLFPGANTNIFQLSVIRPTRTWTISFESGYLRLSQLGQASGRLPTGGFTLRSTSQPNAYQYGFAGVAVQRQLGRYTGAFVSYQFSGQSFADQGFGSFRFGNAGCAVSGACNFLQGHSLSVGLNVSSRPKRLE